MLILWLTAMLQLVAGQNSKLNVKLIPGPPDFCQSREQLAAVDAAIQSIHQTRDEIFSTLHLQCGSVVWTRAAYLNMNDPLQQCPISWRLYSANGVKACGRPITTSTTGGCSSQIYAVQTSYQRVCGRIIGYQIGSTNVFHDQKLPINQPYVDGVSVTYGVPRRHIWTFAGGLSETAETTFPNLSCPCALNGTGIRPQQPPVFVGNSYFCESANPLTSYENTNVFRYTDDPLWDGQRCEGQCCDDVNYNSPPLFSVLLPETTSEDIEVRVCANQETNNEDIAIGLLEIYVQ